MGVVLADETGLGVIQSRVKAGRDGLGRSRALPFRHRPDRLAQNHGAWELMGQLAPARVGHARAAVSFGLAICKRGAGGHISQVAPPIARRDEVRGTVAHGSSAGAGRSIHCPRGAHGRQNAPPRATQAGMEWAGAWRAADNGNVSSSRTAGLEARSTTLCAFATIPTGQPRSSAQISWVS
jgi:hypothetical protein